MSDHLPSNRSRATHGRLILVPNTLDFGCVDPATGDLPDIRQVLPEGAMLNYLLRIPSPVPYTVLMPPEVFTYGESTILKAFRKAPPDYVLLLHKDTSEFGYRFFGIHYGVSFLHWLLADYEAVWRLGPTPLQADAGGLLLLRRQDGRPPAL